MAYIDQDQHFRLFGQSLEHVIAKYGDVAEDEVVERQRKQIQTLIQLESEFRRRLIKDRDGAALYKDFVSYICEHRRNILAARPYFRERQDVFTAQISTALKVRADISLYRFHFNYQFISFVVYGPLDCLAIQPRGVARRLEKLARKIEALRIEIVELNLPLAINRASIFWRRTTQVRQEYMDLVQTCVEGLIAAVDKFCFAPTSEADKWNFPGVAIGRMVGNLIEESSATMLHFYPADRRKLYRAHKAIGRLSFSEIDFSNLASEVNRQAKPSEQTSDNELAGLMAAISCVSSDTPATEDTEVTVPAQKFAADEETRPDVQFEEAEVRSSLRAAASQLTVLERKLLQLKGVAV